MSQIENILLSHSPNTWKHIFRNKGYLYNEGLRTVFLKIYFGLLHSTQAKWKSWIWQWDKIKIMERWLEYFVLSFDWDRIFIFTKTNLVIITQIIIKNVCQLSRWGINKTFKKSSSPKIVLSLPPSTCSSWCCSKCVGIQGGGGIHKGFSIQVQWKWGVKKI